jgi:hypothetical protein
MFLALRFDVHEWVEPAFAKLLRKDKITWDNVQTMGEYPYFQLMKTKTSIDRWKKGMAYWPRKATNFVLCPTEYVCQEAWLTLWWGVFAKEILHPDKPTALDDALIRLEKHPRTQMCDNCRQRSIQDVEKYFPWGKVIRMEEKAVERIIRWMEARAANTVFEDDASDDELGEEGDDEDSFMADTS